MPEFSVVVPVYNVEKYVGRCIQSILEQTFTDFELILVDDGSQDKSGKICDQYALNDERICVIHQKNGGVSKARNAGMLRAKGEFVVFVDSDDTVESNYLLCMARVDKEIDLVIGGVKYIEVDKAQKDKIYGTKQSLLDLNREVILKMIDEGAIDYAVAKRFKKSIIEKEKIHFCNSIDLSEDSLFVANYLCKCHTVAYVKESIYWYYKYDQNTLSSFDDYYIEKIECADEKIVTCLEKRYGTLRESTIWKRRIFSVYYYAIFYILQNELYSEKKKYQLLSFVCKKKNFRKFMNEVDFYMEQDSKIVRRIIASGKPLFILVVWRLMQIIRITK